MARQGEAAPLYSSFLHLHFIFQILSDKQLLSEYNLSCCSFWETYLTTSDPQHKGWTYISYLSCSRKLLRKSFHFCLFLKFWTQIEEYLLKNTVFIFESCPPQHTPRRMVYVFTPLSLLLPRSLLLSHIPQSDLFCGVSRMLGWAWEREKEDSGSSLLLQGSQEAGSQGRGCQFIIWVGHLSWATQRNSTGIPFCRVCSQLPRFPKSGCSDTSITASLSFGGREI